MDDARHGGRDADHLQPKGGADRFSALYEFAPVGYLTITPKGLIEDSNVTAADLLGLPRGALYRKPLAGFVARESQDVFYPYWRQVLKSDTPRACELRMVRADGSPFHAQLESVFVPDRAKDGGGCWWTVIRDVSDRKRDEDALRRAYEEIERRVEERTRDLEAEVARREEVEKQLRAAKEEAEQASQAKSRFMAALGHDLQQPLRAVNLFAGLLRRKVTDREPLEVIRKIESALDTLHDFLSSLLDLSRLDSGVVLPRRTSFPVQALFDQMVDEFADLAAERGLELRAVPCSAYVDSDPMMLERILRNLLSNALRYTGEGRILLGCRRQGDRVRLQVWDTGVGIPPEQRQAIFEEFHKGGDHSCDGSTGLGLGLAIVRRTAELLECPVDMRSMRGKGSMFEVAVPLAPAPGRGALGRRRR